MPETTKRGWIKGLRLSLAVGLIAIVAVLISQPGAREQFTDAASSISMQALALVTGLFAAMRILQAFAIRNSLYLLDHDLPLGSSLNLAGLKGVFNLGFSGLGLAAQSARAKLDLLVPVRVMLFANVIQAFCLVLALGLSLLAATWVFFPGSGMVSPATFLMIGIVAVAVGAGGLAVCVSQGSAKETLPCLRRLPAFGCPVSRRTRVLAGILHLSSYQLGVVLLRVLRIVVIAGAIAPEMSAGPFVISVIVADTVGVVPVTPGGIGIRELIIGLLGTAVERYEVFLAAAIIDRVLTVVLNAVHGAFAVWQSGREA